MHLTSLTLQHFRKWKDLHLDFPKDKVICFVGSNTIGKTNILEGMYVLSLLKSFRTNSLQNVLMWNEQHFSIRGKYTQNTTITELAVHSVFRPKKMRKYFINDIEEPISDYVGHLNVVFFSPDDINLLLLSPSSRRRYLDIVLSQTDRRYLTHLALYQKILKQRNALLKAISSGVSKENELEYWDIELAKSAAYIHIKRQKVIDFCNLHINSIYNKIAHTTEQNFRLEYVPAATLETVSELDYLELYNRQRKRDLILESTQTGPHRDDFRFLLHDRQIDDFASRGDTRSMVLALKLAEIQYIEEMKQQSPLLLLDDVFSELDEERQEHLLCCLPAHIQTFITTTSQTMGVLAKRTKDIHFVDVEHLAQSQS